MTLRGHGLGCRRSGPPVMCSGGGNLGGAAHAAEGGTGRTAVRNFRGPGGRGTPSTTRLGTRTETGLVDGLGVGL